jgi:epoxyqueuosine reductase
VSLLELLAADDDTLLARHGRWYLAGRDPRWLRRNALLAVGNTADPADPGVAGALARYLGDRDPMLRAHAVWACRRLGREDLLVALVGASDPDVAEELAAPAPAARQLVRGRA